MGDETHFEHHDEPVGGATRGNRSRRFSSINAMGRLDRQDSLYSEDMKHRKGGQVAGKDVGSHGLNEKDLRNNLGEIQATFDHWSSHIDDRFDEYDKELIELTPAVEKLSATMQVICIRLGVTEEEIEEAVRAELGPDPDGQVDSMAMALSSPGREDSLDLGDAPPAEPNISKFAKKWKDKKSQQELNFEAAKDEKQPH